MQVYDTNTSDPNDTAYVSTYTINYRKGATYQETSTSVTSSKGTSTSYPSHGVPESGATGRGYNVNGELIGTSDSRDATRNRYFANDAMGQALTVVQGNYDGQSGRWTATQAFEYALENAGSYNATKSQHFFFANGQQVGSYGQLADESGAFRANFDVNYTPVSDNYPASVPSEVVAQKGDTLRILAARIFGDHNLWYLIAEENGLTDPDAQIEPGTVLRIPNEVVSLSNTSTSFKPFDAQAAIGDTSPTQPMPPAPKPKKKKGCGVLGQILMIVVAVVVTVYTAGAAAGWMGATASGGGGAFATGAATLAGATTGGALGTVGTAVTAAAIGGATGSIASQAVGIAAGLQDGFNWKGVAMGALGAGVTAGIGGVANLAKAADAALKAGEIVNTSRAALAAGRALNSIGVAGRAVVGSTVTQGIGVATGLQSSFSWREVAISAVSAPLSQTAREYVGGSVNLGRMRSFAADVAGGLTSVGVRAAAGGKLDFTNVLADVFGNAIGNSIVEGMQQAAALGHQEALRAAIEAKNPLGVSLYDRMVASGGWTPDEAAMYASNVNFTAGLTTLELLDA